MDPIGCKFTRVGREPTPGRRATAVKSSHLAVRLHHKEVLRVRRSAGQRWGVFWARDGFGEDQGFGAQERRNILYKTL